MNIRLSLYISLTDLILRGRLRKGSLDTCILMNKCASLKAILYKRCNEFKSGSKILCSIETGSN